MFYVERFLFNKVVNGVTVLGVLHVGRTVAVAAACIGEPERY